MRNKQYEIGFSEAAMHCKLAGKKIDSYEEIVKGKVIVLNSKEFLHGYFLWDWGYRILDNTINLL